jgi:HlyD family secretion protein
MTGPPRPTGRWLRRLAFALAALAGVGLLAWALAPAPIAVDTALVETGRFERVLREEGRMRVRDRHVVRAPVAGELLRPTLRVGDAVAAGQAVATLRPMAPPLTDARERSMLEARLGAAIAAGQAARAEAARAATALAQARHDAQRAERLAEANFVSPAAVELAQAGVRQQEQVLAGAEGQARAADHAVAEARAVLERASEARAVPAAGSILALASPVAGRVLRLGQEQAGPVAAGQALVEIADTSRLEAVIDLLSADAMLVAAGDRVELRAGEAVPAFAGTVAQVEPVAFTRLSALGIEEQRVNVIVTIDPPPAGATGPGDGFRVDARIAVARRDGALLVPVAALVRAADAGWSVYRVEDGRVRRVAIRLLERNPEQARVEGPLSAGQAVILYPGPRLREGDRVRGIAGPGHSVTASPQRSP